MKPLLTTAVLAVALAVAPTPAGPPVETPPPPEPVPSIADIMQEAHKCRTNYVGVVGREVEKVNPDWPLVESRSRELIRMGRLLAKNTPPKGTPQAWEKITTLYVANAVMMTDAAERRHADDVKYHVTKLRMMCATCHEQHADWE